MTIRRHIGGAAALLCIAAGAAACHQIAGAGDAVQFTAWSIPPTGLQTRIQVSLAPRTRIAAAVLTADSPDAGLTIAPARFRLTHLEPPTFPKGKPHNPPALGWTTRRIFAVRAHQAGDYTVRVRLRWNHHAETRTVRLHFAAPPGTATDTPATETALEGPVQ